MDLAQPHRVPLLCESRASSLIIAKRKKQMKKKRVLSIVGLSAVGLLVLLYLLSRLVRLPWMDVCPESAIPSDSGMIMSTQREWLDKAALAPGALPLFAMPPVVLRQLTDFEKALGSELNLPKEGKLLLTVHPTKSTGSHVLFVYDDYRGFDVGKALKEMHDLKFLNFKGQVIFSGKKNGVEFSVARFRNLLLLSSQSYLVENAIEQLLHPISSVCRDRAFVRLRKEVPAQSHTISLFWNLSHFRTAFSGLLAPTALVAASRLSSFGKWVHLQVPLPSADPTTAWSGGLYPNGKNPLVKAIVNARPLPFRNAFESIPAGSSLMLWLAIDRLKPLAQTDRWNKFFKPWVGHELVLCTGQALLGNSFEQFVLLKIDVANKAEALMPELAFTEGDSSVSRYHMFNIYHLKGDAVNGFLGSQKQWQETWFTSLGHYALFSNSKAGVERWLDQYVVGNTLSKDANFLKSILELPVTAHGFVSFESSKAWQQLAGWLSDEKLNALVANPLGINAFAAAIKKHGNMFNLEIAVQHAQKPTATNTASVLWRVPLGAPLAQAPFCFYHPETKEYLVLVQDTSRKLHLISRSGRALWTLPLDELLMSEIQPIDLHNDGNVQLAFSTRSAIHLLNIQGEEMPGYPIRLLVPATNGVKVVDFFKSNDYSYFIACENGKAYGFDEEGLPLEGWRPRDSVGLVFHPMVHFQAQGMDFLAFLNDQPILKVFRRNGEPRFGDVILEGRFLSPPGWQVSRQSSRIVACNDKGRAWVVNLNGSAFGLSLNAGDNTETQFIYEDVVGDNRKDYVVLSGQDLAIYSYQGSKFVRAATYRFENRQEELFQVKWKNASKSLIGVVDPVRNQIRMLDGKGVMLPWFPLAGDTQFQVVDLLHDDQPVLVVGHNDELYAYLLRS